MLGPMAQVGGLVDPGSQSQCDHHEQQSLGSQSFSKQRLDLVPFSKYLPILTVCQALCWLLE